jgi:spore coat polysaccharide biosynthesis predicted glycosyltransferase SpsG
MTRIIETNLSLNDADVIMDHQSRVIQVESWESFIDEIKNCKCIIRYSLYGNLHGNSIPRESRIDNLVYDDFHLSVDIHNSIGMKTKKLAYLIDNDNKSSFKGSDKHD